MGDMGAGNGPLRGHRGRSQLALVPLLLVALVLVAAGAWLAVGGPEDDGATGRSGGQDATGGPDDDRSPSGTSPSSSESDHTAVPGSDSPFAGVTLYADATSAASEAVANERDPERARMLQKLASQPSAVWFGDWLEVGQVRAAVSATVSAAESAGAVPVLVAYDVPQRDCGGWSSGGASGPGEYRTWISELADGIGDRRAVVVLEPDALAAIDCLSQQDRDVRYDLLAHAVDVLAARPNVVTYVDAGHSDWVPAGEMAARLERVGVHDARGFALNVSNFGSTESQAEYGTEVSEALDDAPFVIDTSRNGLGPTSGENRWCNPKGRALGEPPLSPPPHRRVDALLWIKNPGQSDGECDRGEPPAGTFWPDYAIGLASRAAW